MKAIKDKWWGRKKDIVIVFIIGTAVAFILTVLQEFSKHTKENKAISSLEPTCPTYSPHHLLEKREVVFEIKFNSIDLEKAGQIEKELKEKYSNACEFHVYLDSVDTELTVEGANIYFSWDQDSSAGAFQQHRTLIIE